MTTHQKLVGEYIRELYNYHKFKKTKDFSDIRERLLIDLLIYARKYCHYYSHILKDFIKLNSTNLIEIPFLTKDLIRENHQTIKSRIVPEKMLLSRKTGGSTGEPLLLWSTGNTDFHHQSFLFKLHGYEKGDKILAMDGTLIEHDLVEKNIFWKLKNNGNMFPYGGMALSSLYLNRNNIIQYLNFICEFKPDFIRGYPAFISEIAAYINERKIDIGFTIKAVEVTSELCTENQAKKIKSAFKTKVIGQYGHAEASVFGYTLDETMAYYCSPLYGYTEIVGDDNKHVEVGNEGEIIVTGFSSFGFPLIRYRTGDRAIYGGTKNGIVLLNKILGRTADYIINEHNEKVLLTALIFGQHFNAFSKINRWQIIQDSPGVVKIIIDKANDFSDPDEKEILKTFNEIGKVKVEFDYENNFIKTKAGKTKFVIQNLTVN